MTGLVILLVLAGLVLAWLAFRQLFTTADTDQTTQRAILGLHALHCRLEGGQLRSELRRDGALARRELQDALDRHQDEPPETS